MNRKKYHRTFSAILLSAVFLFSTAVPTLADPRYHNHNPGPGQKIPDSPRHHPYYGKRVSLPEMIATAIFMAGLEYYYYHGVFYKKMPEGYVVVDPPSGIIVDGLPSGYKVVVVNKTTYYYYNDIYFIKKGKKYMVVDDPVYQVAEFPQDVTVLDSSDTTDTGATTDHVYTVNIPNSNGSYTPVNIKKSGNGFVGPQGEFYTTFPSVDQLKVMYGK